MNATRGVSPHVLRPLVLAVQITHAARAGADPTLQVRFSLHRRRLAVEAPEDVRDGRAERGVVQELRHARARRPQVPAAFLKLRDAWRAWKAAEAEGQKPEKVAAKRGKVLPAALKLLKACVELIECGAERSAERWGAPGRPHWEPGPLRALRSWPGCSSMEQLRAA